MNQKKPRLKLARAVDDICKEAAGEGSLPAPEAWGRVFHALVSFATHLTPLGTLYLELSIFANKKM
jgi:hypothetical protein